MSARNARDAHIGNTEGLMVVIRVLVCVMLGTVCTALCAWSSAGFVNVKECQSEDKEAEDIAWVRRGGYRVEDHRQGYTLHIVDDRIGLGVLIRDVSEIRKMKGGCEWDHVGTVTKAGWPCYAFVGWRATEAASSKYPQRFLETIVCRGGSGAARSIPLYPSWFGFVVDTMVFGSAIWLGDFGRRTARRRSRQRRGHCRSCDYDVRGLVGRRCPECGCVGT